MLILSSGTLCHAFVPTTLGSFSTPRCGRVCANVRWARGAREQDCFLHLIQVSDTAVQTMVVSEVNETANQIHLAFTVRTRTHTVSLNKVGGIGGHIRIQDGEELVVDRDLTRGIMPQAGLALAK